MSVNIKTLLLSLAGSGELFCLRTRFIFRGREIIAWFDGAAEINLAELDNEEPDNLNGRRKKSALTFSDYSFVASGWHIAVAGREHN
jgi:hypothetical protein